MNFLELRAYVAKLREGGHRTGKYLVELYSKLSFPLVNVIMALVAIPFALASPRSGGRAMGIGVAIVIAGGGSGWCTRSRWPWPRRTCCPRRWRRGRLTSSSRASAPPCSSVRKRELARNWLDKARGCGKLQEMKARRFTVALWLTLATILVALTPLAYATPPDPVWVSGFFDDDDNDNGVFLITSSDAVVDPFPLCSWTPFPLFGRAVVAKDQGPVSSQYVSSTDARAPPLS
jgi:lipopolysaccharide export system permease LptF/LptG-like protein